MRMKASLFHFIISSLMEARVKAAEVGGHEVEETATVVVVTGE